MSFLSKIYKRTKKVKVDPDSDSKSKKLMRTVSNRLESAGVSVPRDRATCSSALFRETVKYFRVLQRVQLGSVSDDDAMNQWVDGMKAILEAYGIHDEMIQQDIILEFIDIMADVAEGKV